MIEAIGQAPGKMPFDGVYWIQPHSKVDSFAVYCKFDHAERSAWTLIRSYAPSQASVFADAPFSVDRPMHNFDNHDAIEELQAYSLGASQMAALRRLSTHWRAGCNFDFSNDSDVLQALIINSFPFAAAGHRHRPPPPPPVTATTTVAATATVVLILVLLVLPLPSLPSSLLTLQ